EVLLASGPTEQITPSGVGVVWVKTVNELDNLLTTEAPDYDLILMVGSASDWGPMAGSDLTEEEKTKKLDLDIPETPDLGRKLGRLKSEDQVLIEFSTVREREKSEALERLKTNKIDGIFSPPKGKEQQDKGEQASGFLLFSSGEVQEVRARNKSRLASGILNQLVERFYKED
ncbi:hypothetical protein KGY71_08190, partial [Candidatus Bipolaricaulota bacterium]|nr:hypothetical protein [Candidatus Bipolaricaulota bacterium]